MKNDEKPYHLGLPYQKLKRFINTPEHHDLSHTKLLQIYKVSGDTISNKFFPAIGRKTRVELDRERKWRIVSDPDFGIPGEEAPCNAAVVAARTGACKGTVNKLREKHGVLPCPRVAHNKGYEGSPALNPDEIVVYGLCALTKNWGRPEGMEAHLESLQCGT